MIDALSVKRGSSMRSGVRCVRTRRARTCPAAASPATGTGRRPSLYSPTADCVPPHAHLASVLPAVCRNTATNRSDAPSTTVRYRAATRPPPTPHRCVRVAPDPAAIPPARLVPEWCHRTPAGRLTMPGESGGVIDAAIRPRPKCRHVVAAAIELHRADREHTPAAGVHDVRVDRLDVIDVDTELGTRSGQGWSGNTSAVLVSAYSTSRPSGVVDADRLPIGDCSHWDWCRPRRRTCRSGAVRAAGHC